jgi:uncharacterized protein (TIGR03000 family)
MAVAGSPGWWWDSRNGYWWNPRSGISFGSAGAFVQNNYYSYPSQAESDYLLPQVGAGNSLQAPDDEAPPEDTPAAEPAPTPATVEVILPDPKAHVWFNGKRMAATGEVRTFTTPPLEPGRDFTYEVIAAWRDDGRLVTHRRTVAVSAGGTTLVDFTRPTSPPRTAAQEELPPPLP